MTLSETDFKLFKKWLRGHLRAGPVTVTFTKKDGTERKMTCTTDTTLIMFKDPTIVESTSTTTRKVNEDIMPVFDLENAAWKSFRWDSIKQVSIKL